MDWSRISNAAVAFIGMLITQLIGIFAVGGVAAIPTDWKSWLVLICIAAQGGYNKYSSSTRMIAPNRKVFTEDERRATLGLPPKKLIEDDN